MMSDLATEPWWAICLTSEWCRNRVDEGVLLCLPVQAPESFMVWSTSLVSHGFLSTTRNKPWALPGQTLLLPSFPTKKKASHPIIVSSIKHPSFTDMFVLC